MKKRKRRSNVEPKPVSNPSYGFQPVRPEKGDGSFFKWGVRQRPLPSVDIFLAQFLHEHHAWLFASMLPESCKAYLTWLAPGTPPKEAHITDGSSYL